MSSANRIPEPESRYSMADLKGASVQHPLTAIERPHCPKARRVPPLLDRLWMTSFSPAPCMFSPL